MCATNQPEPTISMQKTINEGTDRKIIGFSANKTKPGELAKVVTRGFVDSDENDFYKYIDQISKIFFDRYPLECIYRFLIVLHESQVADIYINQHLPILKRIMAKCDVSKGNIITDGMIADIDELKFHGIKIEKTDSIILCIKEGWRFGLFFDFRFFEKGKVSVFLDVEEMYKWIGSYYKKLAYRDLYRILSNGIVYDNMILDGWFPFIQLLKQDFLKLAEYYEDKDFFQGEIDKFLDRFDKTRLEDITNYWWRHKIFNDKKEILESGINAYLSGTKEGIINCIKNLHSEIDGIVRMNYFEEKGKTPKFPELANYLNEKGIQKFSSSDALGFPGEFFEYLNKSFFKNFQMGDDNTVFSRHTTMHGVADENEYSKARALQAILILDQISFYLKEGKESYMEQ